MGLGVFLVDPYLPAVQAPAPVAARQLLFEPRQEAGVGPRTACPAVVAVKSFPRSIAAAAKAEGVRSLTDRAPDPFAQYRRPSGDALFRLVQPLVVFFQVIFVGIGDSHLFRRAVGAAFCR